MNQQVLEFYNQHKDCKYTPPVMPEELKSKPREAARWLLNHPDFAWLELDIPFDNDTWTKEAKLAEPYYVPHRASESGGWESCCIHGIRTDATENWPEYVAEETPDLYRWTELSDIVPTITDFWKNKFPAEKYVRLRFMKLKPGGYIAAHSDAPGRGYIPGEPADHDSSDSWPINLAIIHPENCHMVLEKFGIVPFAPGKVFLINIRHYHAVINFSNEDRIHMIASSMFKSRANELSEIVLRSFLKQNERS